MDKNPEINIFDLPNEIIVGFCRYLNLDRDIMSFLYTCKYFYLLREFFLYHKKINLSKIISLTYYDNFTHLCMTIIEYQQLKKHLKTRKKQTSNSILPLNLTNLELKNFHGYLRTLTRGLDKLTSLSLRKGCKITVRAGCIPPTVTHLTWETNQKLEPGVLHEGIKVLKVDRYTYSQMSLPSTLTSLYIGRNFNFKFHFNEIYAGLLPEGLEVLSIDCPVYIREKSLPSSLKKIYFGKHYRQLGDLSGKFPDGLELFSLDSSMMSDFLLKLPSDLQILTLGEKVSIRELNFNLLPVNLKVLTLNCTITELKGEVNCELKKIILGKNLLVHTNGKYSGLLYLNLNLPSITEVINLSRYHNLSRKICRLFD